MKPGPRHARHDNWQRGVSIAMCGARDCAFATGLAKINCEPCREKMTAMIAKRVAAGLQRAPGGK